MRGRRRRGENRQPLSSERVQLAWTEWEKVPGGPGAAAAAHSAHTHSSTTTNIWMLELPLLAITSTDSSTFGTSTLYKRKI